MGTLETSAGLPLVPSAAASRFASRCAAAAQDNKPLSMCGVAGRSGAGTQEDSAQGSEPAMDSTDESTVVRLDESADVGAEMAIPEGDEKDVLLQPQDAGLPLGFDG